MPLNVFLKSPAQFIISLMGILTTITYHSLLTMLPNIQVFETHCFGEGVGKQILLHCQCWCELIQHLERAIAVKIMCAFTLWSRNPTPMNLAIECTCTCVHNLLCIMLIKCSQDDWGSLNIKYTLDINKLMLFLGGIMIFCLGRSTFLFLGDYSAVFMGEVS